MATNEMRIFCGNANRPLAGAIASALRTELGRAEVMRFPDGETKVRLLEDVRGRDVFIIQPTCPPVNEHLMELLTLIDASRRASAERITAVIPYFGYARQDRKHEGRVPITSKLVSNLISTAGVDRILTMDLHTAQIQGFFDMPVDHLYARPVLVRYLRRKDLGKATLLSPDPGNIKMIAKFAENLDWSMAFIDKRRTGDTDVVHTYIVGEVKGRNVVVLDDMITTGGTAAQAIKTCRENDAERILLLATHAIFTRGAAEKLAPLDIEEIVVTDTIPVAGKQKGLPNLKVISVAELFAEAIRRTHHNESGSVLFR